MPEPKKRGLGSPNIKPQDKARIQSLGGKASHGGGRKPNVPKEAPSAI
jgi:hypothetical protein